MTQTTTIKSGDVPTRIFEEFLIALPDGPGKAELVNRLRKTLLSDRNFTDKALRSAVLGEDPQQ